MLKLQGSAPSGRLFEPPGSKTGIEYEFVQDNAGIPYRRELSRGAVKLFGEFSVFRDLLILTIGVFSVHLSISTKFGDFALQYDDCAANSWLMIFYLCVLISVVLGSNLVRAVHDLSNLGEVVYDILLIVFGTIMAAAVSFHRWKTESGTTDVCSAANNPSAWGLYLLSDLLGIGAIFRLMLLAYLKPPCGPGAAPSRSTPAFKRRILVFRDCLREYIGSCLFRTHGAFRSPVLPADLYSTMARLARLCTDCDPRWVF